MVGRVGHTSRHVPAKIWPIFEFDVYPTSDTLSSVMDVAPMQLSTWTPCRDSPQCWMD